MKKNQIAAQLYTVRDYLKTPADIAMSMRKIREIGFEAVELSALGPIDDQALMKILDGEGLVCSSTLEPGADIFANPQKIAEKCDIYRTDYVCYPYPEGLDFSDPKVVDGLVEELHSAGEALRKAGKTFGYHNHNLEFIHLDGKLVMDRIFGSIPPEHLVAELDTYWVQAGGGNPEEWITRFSGRLPLLHLKDFGVDTKMNILFEEIGCGNLNWDGILKAAEKAGCRWYIIEQDDFFENNDPFLSLKRSFDYLVENFVEG